MWTIAERVVIALVSLTLAGLGTTFVCNRPAPIPPRKTTLAGASSEDLLEQDSKQLADRTLSIAEE